MFLSSLRCLVIAALLFTGACMGGDLPPLASDGYQKPVYELAPGDRLRITVFGEESLSKEYTISSNGNLAFPLLGEVSAVGISPVGLQQMLEMELGQGYLNEPSITVEVLSYRPIYVLGEVSRSGDYPFAEELTVLQAVALAGGFTYRADRGKVFIRRAGSEQERTYELEDGRAVYVRPGDTIRVGERFF